MTDRPPDLDASGQPLGAAPPDLDAQGKPIVAADFKTTNIPWNEPGGDVLLDNARNLIIDPAIGAVKGLGKTAVGLGRMWHWIPGVDHLLGPIPADTERTLGLEPTNTAQKVGQYAEQVGEFLIPGDVAEKSAVTIASKLGPYVKGAPRVVQAAAELVPRMATQGAASAGVAAAQGGDPKVAALAGAASPVVGGVLRSTAAAVGRQAEPLVRSAIKPTVAAMKRVAGASMTGIDAQANRFVRFIIDEGVTTASKARTIITDAEQELQRVLAVRNAPTDAPQRAVRYLTALEKSAARQALPDADVATIRNAAAEVLANTMGEDVVTMVPRPHPTLVDAKGKPLVVLVPETARALRTDVSATEAMDLARANSRWDTRKAWGEQKGAQIEASKAVERAQRDAVKVAVPEAKPVLARQGQAIQASQMLDRMEFRQGNRDAVSLPAHVMAAGELASGHVPILAFAANWLRNNQMAAGIWADRLAKAIARQDTQEAAAILGRFGVGVTAQAAAPAR